MLTALPDQVCALTTLECLRLFNNAIAELPADMGRLLHLMDLNLSSNRLSQLPETMPAGMRSLMAFDLSWNSLHELPDSFGAMRALTSLNVSHNRLVVLPPCIGKLISVEVRASLCRDGRCPLATEQGVPCAVCRCWICPRMN